MGLKQQVFEKVYPNQSKLIDYVVEVYEPHLKKRINKDIINELLPIIKKSISKLENEILSAVSESEAGIEIGELTVIFGKYINRTLSSDINNGIINS